MANFVIVRDPDRGRRGQFAVRARDTLALFPGLVSGALEHDDVLVMWAAGPRAPVSVARSLEGFSVLFGDARDGATGVRLDATRLAALWQGATDRRPDPADGFHAGVVSDATGGLTVGCDLLGLYPVYYWSSGAVVVVASSPESITDHPCFTARISPLGLAGILLSNGIVGSRALLDGIQRLTAGRLLVVPPGAGPHELDQYALPLSGDLEDLGFKEQVDILASAVSDAVSRALGGDGFTFLLSGGLDSRMLCGVLERMERRPTALTFGRPGDIEARCAAKAASVVRFPHRLVADVAKDPAASARLMARFEHLGNGFLGAPRYGQGHGLGETPQPVLTGHIVDDVVGPKGGLGTGPGITREDVFSTWYGRRGRWGLTVPVVDDLLGMPGLAETVIRELRAELFYFPGRPSKSIWAANLKLRARFHVGASLWRTSFFNWPVNPVLDQRLLATAGALPISTLGERRAQRELVCRYFPALAAVPLDRNSYDDTPLQPRLRYLLGAAIRSRLSWLPRPSGERRYYYRLADFNAGPWTVVRRAAEAGREKVGSTVKREVLDRVLPGPDVPVAGRDGIIDTSGHRMLVGLMLWAAGRG